MVDSEEPCRSLDGGIGGYGGSGLGGTGGEGDEEWLEECTLCWLGDVMVVIRKGQVLCNRMP